MSALSHYYKVLKLITRSSIAINYFKIIIQRVQITSAPLPHTADATKQHGLRTYLQLQQGNGINANAPNGFGKIPKITKFYLQISCASSFAGKNNL